ncbi:ATP-binding protein [Erysipelothrix urinaevulpis]|uniref:ATP-binding protein n=1 Tax=Erysipelothrix urinaevulpis TaxID=2683717 RepID=UPI001357C2B5|nr:ATP-binding protein [Erysipelothrix urinaevulpis]
MNITTGKIRKAQKVILYGPEGIGKSTFASKFPNPLFSDTEGSTTHLDVARFDKPTSWSMLMAQVEYVKQNKPCSTYVIDTADWAESLAKEYVINSASDARIKSIEDYGYGKGYTMLAEEFGRLLNKLQEVVDVGINVLVLAHAHMRKFEQPQEIGSYDRWELKLEKKVSPLLKEWADAVMFATYEIHVVNVDNQGAAKGKNKAQGGSRVMYTSHNPAWDAKNRWGLADKLPFDFNQIASHIITQQANTTKPVQAEVKATNQAQTKEVPKQQPKTEPKQAAATQVKSVNPFSMFPKALQDLMKQDRVTENEFREYFSGKGHFPKEMPFNNMPEDYLKGIIANWIKVITDISEHREPILDIANQDLPF